MAKKTCRIGTRCSKRYSRVNSVNVFTYSADLDEEVWKLYAASSKYGEGSALIQSRLILLVKFPATDFIKVFSSTDLFVYNKFNIFIYRYQGRIPELVVSSQTTFFTVTTARVLPVRNVTFPNIKYRLHSTRARETFMEMTLHFLQRRRLTSKPWKRDAC